MIFTLGIGTCFFESGQYVVNYWDILVRLICISLYFIGSNFRLVSKIVSNNRVDYSLIIIP